MARYKNKIATDRDEEKIDRRIAKYLTAEGFRLVDEDENTWQKGNGWLLWPQYVQYEVRSGKLYLEAWLKFPILPGVYVGEFGIDGMFGFIPKRQLKVRVEAIEAFA